MNYEPRTTFQSGFMALISAIIIAGVLMAVVFSLSFKSFMTRFNILDAEYKKRSLSYAEACADIAILKVIENKSYTGEPPVPFGNETCTISVSGGPSGPYVIHAQSSVPNLSSHKAVSNIQVTLNPNLSVANRKEVPNF